jgi:two-component system, chemotaxis family, response regulator PixG
MVSNDRQDNPQPYNSNLLEQLLQVSRTQASGCFLIQASGITWKLHFYGGTLVYASDSISAWDRLERLLRLMGCQPLQQIQDAQARSPQAFVDKLDQKEAFDSEQQAINWLLQQQYISSQSIAALLQNWTEPDRVWCEDPTYQAIHWLVSQEVLKPEQANALTDQAAKEVIELLLMAPVHESTALEGYRLASLPRYGAHRLEALIESSLQRLSRWQALAPSVWSPYQRPYFFSQSDQANQLSPELKQRLGSMLRGFSFRHLASALKKDDVQLAQSLITYIQQGIVFLREPQEPFNLLPRIPDPRQVIFPTSLAAFNSKPAEPAEAKPLAEMTSGELSNSASGSRSGSQFKIACVDDSLAMLNEISRLLGNDQFAVTAINNPVRALMQIVRVQPDLVLLDVGMPGMDGYELCRLLRNHPMFEKTPVIMVTGHTGIIDRARAKLVGATDYLTKPFTKEGLLKMVTKHLAVTV